MYAHATQLTDFIKAHAHEDVPSLLLRYRNKCDADFLEAATIQIEARRKTAAKLPTFISNDNFMFPSVLAAEQATAEAVALFHARLAGNASAVLDMTAGLGIDAMTFAMGGLEVTAIELDETRYASLKYNNKSVCNERMEIILGDSIEWLSNSDRHFDIIFIDPARRSSNGSRVYGFEHCQPDILKHIELLLSRCNRLMIKASPMLDVDAIVKQIPCISEIYAVDIKGECKEMLIIADRDAEGLPILTSVRLSENSEYRVNYCDNSVKPVHMQDNNVIGMYLYTPSASVLKLGRHAALTQNFKGLLKCSANCSIYVSDKYFENFPGRILKITGVVGKEKLKGCKYNIVCRDYPLTPEQLKKKLGTKDGGENFLYGIRLNGKPTLLECKQI